MPRTLLLALTLIASTSLACKKETTSPPDDAASAAGQGEPETAKFAGRPVVDNWQAKPGDVTVCPISGKKFEVAEDSGHYAYQGYTFVFCCAGKCLEKVEAEPGKYLDDLVEQAGGPASDPDPVDAASIDG